MALVRIDDDVDENKYYKTLQDEEEADCFDYNIELFSGLTSRIDFDLPGSDFDSSDPIWRNYYIGKFYHPCQARVALPVEIIRRVVPYADYPIRKNIIKSAISSRYITNYLLLKGRTLR